ncbi:unnamed protein product [Thelazia callipaeda]|uniref:Transposase n=1 Tax=Thelazia callipaeda TaxID=103827 RepID=A0A0N5CU01_THECL|nr:unnamed protein product [Thelazia callipaeda]
MEDGLSETLARLQQQQHLLDQEQYLKGKNRFRR